MPEPVSEVLKASPPMVLSVLEAVHYNFPARVTGLHAALAEMTSRNEHDTRARDVSRCPRLFFRAVTILATVLKKKEKGTVFGIWVL